VCTFLKAEVTLQVVLTTKVAMEGFGLPYPALSSPRQKRFFEYKRKRENST
jgi:hypothetical protein